MFFNPVFNPCKNAILGHERASTDGRRRNMIINNIFDDVHLIVVDDAIITLKADASTASPLPAAALAINCAAAAAGAFAAACRPERQEAPTIARGTRKCSCKGAAACSCLLYALKTISSCEVEGVRLLCRGLCWGTAAY